MSLQSDNCNDITNSLLCTPIIWNHSEKNWNGISLRVVSEKLNRDNVVLNQANGGGRTLHAMFVHHHLLRVMPLRYSAYVRPVRSVPLALSQTSSNQWPRLRSTVTANSP